MSSELPPLLFARGQCTVAGCVCAGTQFMTGVRVPHDSRHPCYCGHYLHSHVPRSEEHQHVVASGNAQWHKGPMPQNLCACFYSSQRKWNQGSICICTGPWVGHGFWEGDESVAQPVPNRPDRPSTLTTIPLRPYALEAHSNPLAAFGAPTPDFDTPEERRHTSIAAHLHPETRRPPVDLPRGSHAKSKVKAKTGKNKALVASVDFKICILPFTTKEQFQHSLFRFGGYALTQSSLPPLVTHLEGHRLVFLFSISEEPTTEVWRQLNYDLGTHALENHLHFPSHPGSQVRFSELSWRLYAPSQNSRNADAIRVLAPVSVTGPQFNIRELQKLAARLTHPDGGPSLLFIAPTFGHVRGGILPDPGSGLHACFPWRALKDSSLLPPDYSGPDTCLEGCPQAPPLNVRPRPASLEIIQDDQRPPHRQRLDDSPDPPPPHELLAHAPRRESPVRPGTSLGGVAASQPAQHPLHPLLPSAPPRNRSPVRPPSRISLEDDQHPTHRQRWDDSPDLDPAPPPRRESPVRPGTSLGAVAASQLVPQGIFLQAPQSPGHPPARFDAAPSPLHPPTPMPAPTARIGEALPRRFPTPMHPLPPPLPVPGTTFPTFPRVQSPQRLASAARPPPAASTSSPTRAQSAPSQPSVFSPARASSVFGNAPSQRAPPIPSQSSVLNPPWGSLLGDRHPPSQPSGLFSPRVQGNIFGIGDTQPSSQPSSLSPIRESSVVGGPTVTSSRPLSSGSIFGGAPARSPLSIFGIGNTHPPSQPSALSSIRESSVVGGPTVTSIFSRPPSSGSIFGGAPARSPLFFSSPSPPASSPPFIGFPTPASPISSSPSPPPSSAPAPSVVSGYVNSLSPPPSPARGSPSLPSETEQRARMIPSFTLHEEPAQRDPLGAYPRASAEEIRDFVGPLLVPYPRDRFKIRGPNVDAVATTLLDWLKFEAPYDDACSFTVTEGCVLNAPALVDFHARILEVRIAAPLPVNDATGDGPVRAVFAAGLRQATNSATWGLRSGYRIPQWVPMCTDDHQRGLWAAGRWAALSLIHRRVAPEPISPLLLLACIVEADRLCDIPYDLLYEFDPVAARQMAPWIQLEPETTFDQPFAHLASTPLGQLLIDFGYYELSMLKRPRDRRFHRGVGGELWLKHFLGLNYRNSQQLKAFRDGFTCQLERIPGGPRIPEQNVVQAFASARTPELVAGLYDCRVHAVGDITDRLEFVTTEHATIPDVYCRLFTLFFERWLRGPGHPSNTRGEFVEDARFEEDRSDPLTRSRLFMEAMVDSQAMPRAPEFKFRIVLRCDDPPTTKPLVYFQTCFAQANIYITDAVANMLLEPCDLHDIDDAILFDQWLHSMFILQGDYNRV
ncbi:hypothetical protein B0H11DRAFT_2242340 [Mycena galericulata]|nr:hypothetical protein B0H11DRAFT_2242340 [Mycena galericulata]